MNKHCMKLVFSVHEQGEWGLTEVDSNAEFKRAEDFQRKFIPGTRAQLRVLHQSYQVCRRYILFLLSLYSKTLIDFESYAKMLVRRVLSDKI